MQTLHVGCAWAYPVTLPHTLCARFFGRAGEEWAGGFGDIGIPNTMKSHFAFCFPCMTADKACHKWGLTFHLAGGEQGSWHDGKATLRVCERTKRGHIGFPRPPGMYGN